MLGGHGILVPGGHTEDIARHGEAAKAFSVNWAVIQFECHAGTAAAIDFFRNFVVLHESLAKMIQVCITNVLNGEVVDDEWKHDEVPFVVPETRGGGCLVVVEFGKAASEVVVSKVACLGETVYS